MHNAIMNARVKIKQNAEQGCRTLLLCFYAGRGYSTSIGTAVYLNSNSRDYNLYSLQDRLESCVRLNGAYVISLFACSRKKKPELSEETK